MYLQGMLAYASVDLQSALQAFSTLWSYDACVRFGGDFEMCLCTVYICNRVCMCVCVFVCFGLYNIHHCSWIPKMLKCIT